jgi:hypothetical protein
MFYNFGSLRHFTKLFFVVVEANVGINITDFTPGACTIKLFTAVI